MANDETEQAAGYAEYADPSAYEKWIVAGIVLFAAGLVVAGLGEAFAPKHMSILGNFLRIPAGVLLTAGILVAGLRGEQLSSLVRVGAVAVAGFLALFTF